MALNTGLFNVAPGESPKEGDARRRMALALMQEGMSTDPIKSPWQGVANLAKSLIGGYDLGKMEQEDKAQEENMQKGLYAQIKSLGPQADVGDRINPTPSGGGINPSPVAAALSGGPRPPGMIPGANGEPARPRVASSPTVMGDNEAVAKGLYEGSPSPGTPAPGVPMPQPNPMRSPVASALAGPAPQPMAAPQPAQQPQRRTPTLSQQEVDYLLGQVPNKQARAPLVQHLMDLQKPKDQWSPGVTSEGVQYDTNRATGERKWAPPQTNVSVNTAQQGQHLMAQKSVEDFQTAQQAGREAQKRVGQWDALEGAAKGFQPGATAEMKLSVKKYLKDVGLIAGEDVPDAQVFKTLQTQLQVHAQPKGQGGVSNYERELFASSIANMKMDPAALTKAIRISRELDQFDQKVASIYRESSKMNAAKGGVPDAVWVNEQISGLGSPLSKEAIAFINQHRGGQPGTAPAGGAPTTQPQRTLRYDANGKPL